jgi:hypothetical protein
MFSELPADVQRQARRAYRIFGQNPNQPSFVSSLFILHGQFIRCESVEAIEQWESWKATRSCGIGLACALTMTNFFHSRDADPNYRLETGREKTRRLSLKR